MNYEASMTPCGSYLKTVLHSTKHMPAQTEMKKVILQIYVVNSENCGTINNLSRLRAIDLVSFERLPGVYYDQQINRMR